MLEILENTLTFIMNCLIGIVVIAAGYYVAP
jgi:hypothetical protein